MKNFKKTFGRIFAATLLALTISVWIPLIVYMIVGTNYLWKTVEGKEYTWMWFDNFQRLLPNHTLDQHLIFFGAVLAIPIHILITIGISFILKQSEKNREEEIKMKEIELSIKEKELELLRLKKMEKEIELELLKK